MTREEFIRDICDFGDLRDFCYDYDYDSFTSDILTDDELDEWLNDWVSGNADGYDWYRLRDILSNIPTGCDYYNVSDGIGDIEGYSSDGYEFDDFKEELLERLDNDDFWDEEEEEDDADVEIDFSADAAPEEDFSISELMGLCDAVSAGKIGKIAEAV